MNTIKNWLDRSALLSRLITWLSTGLASRRGLPVMAALVLTVVALVINILWVLSDSKVLGICGLSVLSIAVFIGFLGVLLAEPLGRG